VRFAVAGACGWAGRHHLEALRALGHEVPVIVDPAPDCAEVARRIGARGYASLDRADLAGCDAGTVALRPDVQPDVVARMVGAGLHVFCEKPMAANAHAARMLADLARASNRVVLPGYLLRFHPRMLAFERALAALGTIRRLACVSHTAKPTLEGWRTQVGAGGVAIVNAIHTFDLVNWLVGAPLTVCAAEVANAHFDVPAEDTIRSSMRSETGALVSLFSAWTPHPPVSREGILIDGGWQLRVEVETDRGSLVLTRGGYRVGDVDHEVSRTLDRNPFEIELEHFVDVVAGRARPVVTADDNHAAQQLADDSLRAAGARPAP
jgi:predicted dehydrogenase